MSATLVDAQPITVDNRFWQLAKQMSIQRLEDAINEVITNTDDAYQRLGETGERCFDIHVHGLRAHKVIVIDQALGMTSQEMVDKLTHVGGGSAVKDSAVRGYFQRGAKDITWIGDIYYHSMKDDLYSQMVLTSDGMAGFVVRDQPCTDELRENMGITGNGVRVELHVKEAFQLPEGKHPNELYSNLINQVALRDIMANPLNKIVATHWVGDQVVRQGRVGYIYPQVDQVLVDKTYKVPKYEHVEFTFKLYRVAQPLPEPAFDSQLQFGVVISSGRALHEVTCFRPTWRNHLAMPYIYGRLECPHIMEMLHDIEDNGPSAENPFALIDPARKGGINVDHPFIKQLYSIPTALLEGWLDVVADQIDDSFELLGDASQLIEKLQVFGTEVMQSDNNIMRWFQEEQGIFARALKDISDNYEQSENDDIPLTTVNPVAEDQKELGQDAPVEVAKKISLLEYLEYDDLNLLEQGTFREGENVEEGLGGEADFRRPRFSIRFSNIENPSYEYNIYKNRHEVVLVIHLNYPLVKDYFAPDEQGQLTLTSSSRTFLADTISEAMARILLEHDEALDDIKYQSLTPLELAHQVFRMYEAKHKAIDQEVDQQVKTFDLSSLAQ